MQAIITKFLVPTNTRGARVKASCQAGSVTVPWDNAQSVDANHKAAAFTLAKRYGWVGNWYGGGMPDGTGNVYICTNCDYCPSFTITPPVAPIV